jgi:hypothetical protein
MPPEHDSKPYGDGSPHDDTPKTAGRRLYEHATVMRQIMEHFKRKQLRKIMLLEKAILPRVFEVMYQRIPLEAVIKFDRAKVSTCMWA